MDWRDDRAALARAAARSRRTALAWRRSAAVRRAAAAFGRVAAGDAEGVARGAAALLADDAWIGGMVGPLLRRLARDPLFEPPVRVNRDPLRTGAVLFEAPAVSITASVLSADALRALPPPSSVIAAGRLTVTRYVRAGGAMVERWAAGAAGQPFRAADAVPAVRLPDVRPADGEVRVTDGRREAALLTHAAGDVVTVTAAVRYGAAALQREYRRADGRFLRAGSLDDAGSRTRMLLTLLRLQGRADAGGCFAAATRADAFELRWAAMREWLATDAAAARGRLEEMARDPHPEVAAAARATLPLVRGQVPGRAA